MAGDDVVTYRSNKSKAVVVLVAIALVSLFSFPATSAAQPAEAPAENPSDSGGEAPNTDNEPDSEVSSEGRLETVIETTETSERPHETHVFTQTDENCARWRTETIVIDDGSDDDADDDADDDLDIDLPLGGDPDILYPEGNDDSGPTTTTREVCDAWWECHGERIDEIYTGEISGESEKAYAEYVQIIGSIVQAFVPFDDWNIADPETFRTLAEALANGGLGERPGELLMPVFYYCLRGEGGPLFTGIGGGIDDVPFVPTFGWDTEVETEYDIDTTRTLLVDEALATLRGRDPGLTAIPPLEQGYSIVKFPMWLWLDNPLQEHVVHAYSDPATVRVSIAAIFNRVEWNMGGEIVSCELDDMIAYEGGDPTENIPDCHHIFNNLVDYELTAEVFYDVYERISFRGSTSIPWPNNLFVVHPTDPILIVDADAGPMSVHQLLSLNVNEEQVPG